jgi:hypothetical protein
MIALFSASSRRLAEMATTSRDEITDGLPQKWSADGGANGGQG